MSQRILLKEFAPFQRIRFVNVLRGTDGYVAEPILGDSALISVLVRANGFVIIPKRKTLIEKGEKVDVYSLPGAYKM